jgi:hypothetical protein
MLRSRLVVVVAAAFFAVLLAGCPASLPPTEIVRFDASAASIQRGQAVRLSWEARHPGSDATVPSCRIGRRFEGKDAELPFAVACSGSFDDVPSAPDGAGYVRYQLSVLKQPRDALDPYVTAVVTVTFVDPVPTVSVALVPDAVTLVPNALQSFVATVTGSADTAVNWSASCGVVAGSGNAITYVAPPTEGSCTLTAASTVDATASDAAAVTVSGPAPGTALWTRQFGTGEVDMGGRVAVDADGSVVVVGFVGGDLAGVSAGGLDAFVRKFDANGEVLWTRQFGSSADDGAAGVALDPTGHVYVVGWTAGDLWGSSAGGLDAFVRKFDAAGEVLWTRQFGTAAADQGIGIAVDADGHVLMTGITTGGLVGANAGDLDVFVRKYDADGGVLWTRQFGTGGSDYVYAIAVDAAGRAIVAGSVYGSLAGSLGGEADAFVRKYDADGGEVWTRQFGTSGFDEAFGVAVDGAGHVYVVGGTAGDLEGSSSGSADAFVRTYDAGGGVLWTRQFGTSDGELAWHVAVDAAGQVLVAGFTFGSLEAAANAGEADAFVRKFDAAGGEIWTRQFGTSSRDEAVGVAVDAAGFVLVAGYTDGPLEGTNRGMADVFLRRYSP